LTFPVYFNIFGITIHPHLMMELIAYPAGFQLYLFLRRRSKHNAVPLNVNLWIVVGCIIGALVGAKILALFEDWPNYWANRGQIKAWMGGKTIVGALLGGWIGVEITKKLNRIGYTTGDLYVFPLIGGMAIGRVGCFLTGLTDKTFGDETTLPWGVDFGDGVTRHPTQLYEIGFLILLAIALVLIKKKLSVPGHLFRVFMLGYLSYRFAIEFIKPVYNPYAGLSLIQLASLAGIIWCIISLIRTTKAPQIPYEDPAHA
jgi:phosphatidylglycerol:prolipoprotein diacylglycerol transferase